MLNTLFTLIKQTPPMFYILIAGLLLLLSSYLKEERKLKGKRKELTFAEHEDEHEFWRKCECPTYTEKEVNLN